MRMNCPHCGQKYDVDDEYAGKEAECSACGKVFTVTALENKPTTPLFNITCPHCKQKYDVALKTCPYCGKEAYGPVARYFNCVAAIFTVGVFTFLLFSCISDCNDSARNRLINGSQIDAGYLVIQSIEKQLLNPKRSDIKIDYSQILFDPSTKTYVIPGTVEAPNLFGAMLLKKFVAEVVFDGQGYKLTKLDIE